jgi:DDE superfamily endonuclease
VRGIHEGRLLQDMEFDLHECDKSGNVVRVKYQGTWIFLVDNGYLNWATTIAPFKNTTTSLKEYRWSEWLESMRKDAESTFGILKWRWRLLKTGIRLHSHKATDMIWKACCALHNWLLVDGLA